MNKKINKKLQLKKITIQSLDREEQKKVNGGSDVFRTVTPVFCIP
ncbi:MAG: class I lanthipeptide [Candidatus Aminicenantes bacterium]|nr:MAG: class I lanthipeptide [Candidatus Aminicenantes bacterium]